MRMLAGADGAVAPAARWSAATRSDNNGSAVSDHPAAFPEPKTIWLQNLGIAIEVFMPALALVFCVLRAYIRVKTRNLGWDDGWIFSAMFLCIAQAITSVLYIKWTYIGIHNDEVPPYDQMPATILSYIIGLIYNPILSMVKVSVLVFLLRLASTKRAVRIIIWVIMAFTIGLMIAIFFCVLFVCIPVQYNWDPNVEGGGHCFDRKRFAMWTSAVVIFTDLITLALPFWIFLGLRMASRAKMALLGVFALGVLVPIASSVRLYFLWQNSYEAPGPDSNFSIGFVTTAFETNLAVMAASGPALWPLARRWFPALFSNLGLSRGYQGDIPDIQDGSGSGGGAAAGPKRSGLGLFRFRSGGAQSGKQNPRSGSAGNRRRRGTGAPNVYATHTVGGTAFGLKDLGASGGGGESGGGGGDKPRVGHRDAELGSCSPSFGSEDEIMIYSGLARSADSVAAAAGQDPRRARSFENEADSYYYYSYYHGRRPSHHHHPGEAGMGVLSEANTGHV